LSKKLSNSGHSAMRYPAVALLGLAATRRYPQLTTMHVIIVLLLIILS